MVPTEVQAIDLRPMRRYREGRDLDRLFFYREDPPGAQGRDPLRPGVTLMGWIAGDDLLALGIRVMVDVVDRHGRDVASHCFASGIKNILTTSDMPSSGVKVMIANCPRCPLFVLVRPSV